MGELSAQIRANNQARVSLRGFYEKFAFFPQKQLLNIFRILGFMAGLVKRKSPSRNNYKPEPGEPLAAT
jgi:hypothetical protein